MIYAGDGLHNHDLESNLASFDMLGDEHPQFLVARSVRVNYHRKKSCLAALALSDRVSFLRGYDTSRKHRVHSHSMRSLSFVGGQLNLMA